ncbi:hypothetical protein P175DRAFT_0555611 [Aspergillus ochraceoroseus IBT 24754]|uniref:DNA repair and recombination protein RAD54B n=2 Tax=Aspergillus ochraceoroseus TaxID=138278 RepID=A0A2T5M347_9EURO|nr:uncharacterized protein P175DRAFT_0555611 [Aspergillus ochraceoroseus IBT 24754]KKK14856.1 hypothetical protein AOCH_001765 [Aspergillus ochraceoroseus]PTU22951.1 hypothetical protein P175DRAFT_0555611 [Aspergillus ochraceoroseus IBT 24754]
MVFKPFKPPSVRKPFQPPTSIPKPDLSDTAASKSDNDDENHADDDGDGDKPLKKRPRLASDTNTDTDKNTRPAIGLSTSHQRRRPLLQVNNGSESSLSNSSNSGEDVSIAERYFNVLWRKPTTKKKNKTWDGDGILSSRDGYVYLQDVSSGKDMGRAMQGPGATLNPGVVLSVGGKEVEIDSEIPRTEYLSGKRFLENNNKVVEPARTPDSEPAAGRKTRMQPEKKAFVPASGNMTVDLTVSPVGKNTTTATTTTRAKIQVEKRRPPGLSLSLGLVGSASKNSAGVSSAYKRPLVEGAVVPPPPSASSVSSLNRPVPRHDPNQPGALVMKRPDTVPKGKQVVDVVVDPILGKHLRQHQREGVQFLYECVMGMRSFTGEGAILADDMGLGKTLQTITLLWTLLKQNPVYESPPVIKKALIVCPVTLINNWRKEFRKWLGNERIGVFVFDDKRKRLTDFTMGKAYSIMIVGYEKLRTVQEGLARGSGVDIVIADEGHRLKTLQNKSGQAIQSLSATKRVILSGTPIQNDLKELFAAVDLVNPGVLGSFKSFIKEFEGPIVRSRQPEATRKDIEKGEARNEELRELTSKFMLRRTADILAKYLPPKTEYVLFCNPTTTQAKIYQNVLSSPVFQCALGNSESALQLITILKKLCNSPSLLAPKNTDDTPSETIAALLSSLPPNLLRHFSPSSSAKIRVLDQLLHNLRTSTTEKIVLVSNYTSTLNLLATLLTSLSLPFLRLDGSTPAQKRQALVEDFNRLPANLCFAFLLSAKAGGTGLNLIGASRLVLFDVDWNPATDIQAMARIHRDGQKRPCHIYRILLKGSLEEKIWQRQVTKLGLADSVMERKDSVAQFSRDELKDLFRLDTQSKCQTHELLACDCGGRGDAETSNTGSHSPVTSLEEKQEEEEEEEEEEEDDFPDLPTLIKASELDMEKQEQLLRTTTAHQKRKLILSSRRSSSGSTGTTTQKNKMIQQSLSQYLHIDPLLLFPLEDANGAQTDGVDGDDNNELQQLIDDEVLRSVLRSEENRVHYIFKKASSSEMKGGGASVFLRNLE